MASTAALLSGLSSFDSSDAGASRAGGGVTLGGITFGSVADSFHSEEEEEREEAAKADKAEGRGAGREEMSLLEEEPVGLNMGSESEEWDAPGGLPGMLGRSTAGTALEERGAGTGKGEDGRGSKAIPSALLDMGPSGESRSEEVDSSGVLRELQLEQSGREVEVGGWGAGKVGVKGVVDRRRGGSKAVEPQSLTLREQEKVIDTLNKENFDLKLKIHFYEQALDRLAPDQIDVALKENIQLKVDFQTLRSELKRYKKLLLEGNRAIEHLTRDNDKLRAMGGSGGDGGRARELEKEMARRKERADREREEWERRFKEQEREMRKLRDTMKNKSTDPEEEENARAEIERLRDELDAEREAREDLLGSNEDLRLELGDAKDLLEEAQDELEALKDGGGASMTSSNQSGVRGKDARELKREGDRLGRKVDDLEQDNTSLRSQIAVQITLLSARNAEKDALQDEVDVLKQDINNLEHEVSHLEKTGGKDGKSRDGDDKTREELEDENDEYRDRATSHALDLEKLEALVEEKEQEIEALLQDLDLRDSDHAAALKETEDEWRGELEDARSREAEAREVLEDKEEEMKDLADKMEALAQDLAERESEMAADAEEVEALTADLKNLAAQILAAEDDVEEKDAKIQELELELNVVDKELLDKETLHAEVLTAIKEKHISTQTRLNELTIQHERVFADSKVLRNQVDVLSLRTVELEAKSRRDAETNRALEDEADELTRALRKEEEERDLDQHEFDRQRQEEEKKWAMISEHKERDLDQARTEMSNLQRLLAIREQDMEKLQDALNGLESSTQRLGESHTNDRFSLTVEMDRVKRDLVRCQEALETAKSQSEQRDEMIRERDMDLATLESEVKDLASQLAYQTQTRLNITDKYDQVAKALRNAQTDLTNARDRLRVLEGQLSTDSRALSRTESQNSSALGDRNALLLNIYQHMDKIVSDKSPRKGQSEPRPATHFSSFQDSVMSRLKGFTQVHSSFDRRTKEIETKFVDQMASLKRQLDLRLRQLDRFEVSIKAATDSQKQWRLKLAAKQAELDAAKAAQAGAAPDPTTDAANAANIAALTTRATTAERRLTAYQTQLASAEDKLGEARAKVAVAEGKWEARLRELEARLKAGEEKLKRERQGAKERVGELAETIKDLSSQVSGAQRRDHLLGEVISTTEQNKVDAAAATVASQ